LRTVHNNNDIQKAVKSFSDKPNVVVVGSSFIGMELASVTSKNANVTVVGIEKTPFERVLGEKVGEALGQLHTSNGVKLIMNANVESLGAKGKYSTSRLQVLLLSTCMVRLCGIY
jgi:NADPH-dependent 2,4-dienoyl-CoA reductase/sulfur reductase-like enzyme